MPTLRPQELSGLVVIPTIESEPGIHRVSVAVNVGHTRSGSPPLDVVTREDLVVEVRNPAEGAFEPIASPDPGPLPVRALRVAQARGEFTYAQGVNTPTEVSIALRGDRRSFPLNQPLAPTSCLGREPGEGDPFPKRRKVNPFLRFIQSRRPRCCVSRFEVPFNVAADPSVKSERFEIEADFLSRRRKCSCKCCEYRQYVRGTFTDANGATVRFDMPSGALDPTRYCEDGSTDEFGASAHGYYGHRTTDTSGDTYGKKGCSYRGDETASCPPTEGAHLEYLGLVVDVCRSVVVAKRTWTVDL